ncbi:MAG: hypothetical protein NC299_10680 [Lachnospiraceae bacterium]|nr:hypothetical protein [Ruminococcus sp.]MCM1275813.1 hypothetical protein [Lachnospiraceae bacterium]
MKITDYIPLGRKNAISNEQLALILNTDKRTARALVLAARMRGAPICSVCGENGGYYMPRDIGEAQIYLRQQRARVKSSNAALRGIKDYIKRNGGFV